jgi:hypothetical protein
LPTTSKIYFDHHAGVACFFDSFIVQMENGVTESKFLHHYARHEKMRTICHDVERRAD